MAKFQNLLNISTDFAKIPKAFYEIFKDDYKEMVLLLRLIDTMETFNSWNKLQEDKSFYISLSKIEQLFFNSISRPTIVKLLTNLENKGFIFKKVNHNSREANFYIINCDKINKLCDTKTKRVYEKDEIEPIIEDTIEVKPKTPIKKETKPIIDYDKAINLWNTLIADKYTLIKSIKGISGARLSNFNARLKESKLSVDDFFKDLASHISSSSFLQGQNSHNWAVDFNWAMRPDKYLVIIEDTWKDKTKKELDMADEEFIDALWDA